MSEDDPILEAMATELRRSRQGLRVPGSPRPYYLSYVLRRQRELVIEAAYGSLLRRRDRESGSLGVDLRVGSHEFDNVIDGGLGGDDGQRESADWLIAPDDLDPIALRCALWKLTQIKFDEALEDYYDHRKAMVSEYLRDEVASFTREQPVRHVEELDATPLPIEGWCEQLRELSRRLLAHPQIHDPIVAIRGERLHRWQVDSEGSVVRCSDTLIMKNHGAVTVGANLMDAFKKLDMIEHTARILWLAHAVRGQVDPLPPEAVEKLLATRAALGIQTKNVLENRCGLSG